MGMEFFKFGEKPKNVEPVNPQNADGRDNENAGGDITRRDFLKRMGVGAVAMVVDKIAGGMIGKILGGGNGEAMAGEMGELGFDDRFRLVQFDMETVDKFLKAEEEIIKQTKNQQLLKPDLVEKREEIEKFLAELKKSYESVEDMNDVFDMENKIEKLKGKLKDYSSLKNKKFDHF